MWALNHKLVLFLLCRNRTNSWCRAHMYFLTCFPPFVRCIGDRSQYYKIFLNTHIFQMLLSWHWIIFVPYFGAESIKCTFWRYISISPASTHINGQHNHLATLLLYHLHTENIEMRGYIRGRPIVVREIVTLI